MVIKMTSIRIRGIYTTALTKFFIDRGYMINQMSDTMRERFPDSETHDVPNVDIKHTRDLQGISLVGDREALEQIATDLTSAYVDVFTLRSTIDLYGIYKGSIIKTNNETIVNLGTDIGILPEPTDEEEVLVQVLEMNDKPLLTTRITFSGEYSVIIPEDDIKISRKIRDDAERERLVTIGRKVKPQAFGVLWRTSSEYVDEDVLVAEARELSKNAEFVMEKYDQLDGPGLIKEGKSHMKILFGSQSKHRLDEVRNTIVPTMRQHHMLKSAGRDISFAVDVVEKIKAERDIRDIDGLFHAIFRQVKGPKIGDDITLEHVKPSSHTVFIEGAKVKRYAPPYIKLKRYMAPRGYYDGLDVRKDPGDYCITEMEEGAWHFKHTYFDRNNEEKGAYFNICTPIEIFPTKIRYIDLEVDVVRFPDGESHIIDEELLEKRVEEGIFPEKIASIAMREADMIKNSYESEVL
jgi:Ribonuclease G/E